MIDWLQTILDDSDSSNNGIEPKLRKLLVELIDHCESIYHASAHRALVEFPHRIGPNAEEFEQRMQDLFRGLLIKVFISICWSDRYWSDAEKEAAQIILKRAWNVELCSNNLKRSLSHVASKADTLQWPELLRPFTDIPELREELPKLKAIITRMANLLAKVDRDVSAEELLQMEELNRTLDQIVLDASGTASERTGKSQPSASQQSQSLKLDQPMMELLHSTAEPQRRPRDEKHAASDDSTPKQNTDQNAERGAELNRELNPEQREKLFQEGMQELESLIGLDSIKQDVKQLVNFLKMQTARSQMSLPTTAITLHTLFTGNPGTGKTTVARIVGKLLCGLGFLNQGHTVEADRSALVAQYAGQTAPKTHACVDKALGGVLFVDEAYSLVAENGEDAYGDEAVQVLLKRMEDDRNRLVVVLAGYPEPMDNLVKSNPGLSSRFQRSFEFPDYSPDELLKIFLGLCRKNHYKLTKDAARKLQEIFRQVVEQKDQHFGNGRTVRNLFEKALQRMATRVVQSSKMTEELLTVLQPSDIELT